MFTLLHPSSSIRDIFLSLSMSFGKRAAILCSNKTQTHRSDSSVTDVLQNSIKFVLFLECLILGTYIEVDLVDLVDDLQVSGQERGQQLHRPALQSLGEDCVVGVRKSALGEIPGLQRRGSVYL